MNNLQTVNRNNDLNDVSSSIFEKRKSMRTMRPKTAGPAQSLTGSNDPTMMTMGSRGRTQLNRFAIDQSQTKAIWEALGAYISKNMKFGKGVWIPKFGQFSFTGMSVDLAGSTNPQIRDRQDRFPVFLIGKDFAPPLPLRCGIAAGSTADYDTNQSAEMGNAIREYGNRGLSGIIPKVKINYFELASYTEGLTNKDECKAFLEATIKQYSDQVRAGQAVQAKIPSVGKLVIRNNIAGVIFDRNFINECRGNTAKQFQNLFSRNNWMNDKIYQPNMTNYGAYSVANFNQAPDFQLTMNAKGWLKNNLDIDVNNIYQNGNMTSPSSANRKGRTTKSAQNNRRRFQRNSEFQMETQTPQRFVRVRSNRPTSTQQDHKSQHSISRQSSWINSTFSKVPDLAPFQLMNLANQIFNIRSMVCDELMGKSSRYGMRDILSSSQIYKIFQNIGYRIHLGELKALLKELGYSFNGPSCSMQQLLAKVKEYLNPELAYNIRQDNQTQDVAPIKKEVPPEQAVLMGVKKKEGSHTVHEIIKELFYSTGKTLYQIFKINNGSNFLDFDQFKGIVDMFSNSMLDAEDIRDVFDKLSSGLMKDRLSFKDFEDGFKMEIPKPGSTNSEIKVLKKVREWMFQRQMPTSSAFERLVRSSDRLHQKTMRRVDFHKAFIINQAGLTAPEIDFLFNQLANGAEEVNYNDWTAKIYDDVTNPLQLIREIVLAENLDSDDLLFQMKLKPWDDALDLVKFQRAMRCLDPSFSDSQTRALFDKLKGTNGRLDVQVFLQNVTGSEKDTVDYRQHMYKQLYQIIVAKGKKDMLYRELENSDTECSGVIRPEQLVQILKRVTGGNSSRFSTDEIQKFVRQLPKNSEFKVLYNEFIDKMCLVGNKDYNPFKSLVQRLQYFLDQNKLNVKSLLNRLRDEDMNVSIEKFAEFLKMKVEKKKDQIELFGYAQLIDVDKDGIISDEDLRTCLNNLHSTTFYQNNGCALSQSQFNSHQKFFPTTMKDDLSNDKVFQICLQIRKAMIAKKVSTESLFKKIDTKQLGLINLGQFITGMKTVVNIANPILEKLFNFMDQNQIGMVDYAKFDKILQIQTMLQIPKNDVQDSFNWQEDVINQIKRWVKNSKLNAIEAFRSFDQDFNGLISKQDMKQSLIQYLDIKPEDITDIKLDRLFRLLSFYKTNEIQTSDFERLLRDQNPYLSASKSNTINQFTKSMGGGYVNQSTHNWKFAAIQQIGLLISKKYKSLKESFEDAAKTDTRVNFQKFKAFVQKHDALKGFNITDSLMQKVFAELDPHKKTFLTFSDWSNSFEVFNHKEHSMVELKNFLQCQFANCGSAYAFFQSFGIDKHIDYATFSKAITSLISTHPLDRKEIYSMFSMISQGNSKFSEKDFMREFETVEFVGKQLIKPNIQAKSAREHGKAKQFFGDDHMKGNVETSKWETDIIDKLKRMIRTSGKSLDAIFAQIDTNNSGDISPEEFHKAMKLINIGLTDQEINKLLKRVDSNNDGSLSYEEFVAKFRDDPQFEQRMFKRANNRLAHMKEQMILYMTSATDAFRMFDSSNTQKLQFLDFDKLVRKLCKLSNEKVPCYTVIKDMFDAIDMRKDAQLDLQEWNIAFGGVETKDPKISIRQTKLSHWENSAEASKVTTCIARNRKLLREKFTEYSSHSDHLGQAKYVTFKQAKRALDELIAANFKGQLTDDKLKCILRVSQVVQKIGSCPGFELYDFNKLLNVYKDRHYGPQIP